MKLPICTLFLAVLASIPSLRSQIPDDAIDTRFGELASKPSLTTEDIQWLQSVKKEDEITECIVIALLFKHDRGKYLDDFQQYFRIDKSHETNPQSSKDINDLVNGMMKSFKERTPLEVVTRIYLRFRGTHQTNVRKDGSEMYLEMMFRASVFQGIFNTTKEGVLELSAAADYKK